MLFAQRALLFVEIIISGIAREPAAVDLDDLGDDAIDELAIMRRHQQRAFVAFQKLLKPDQAFEIEMVARLVEQHDVGPHQQNPRQCNAHLPAARQRADIAVHHLVAKTESGEHFASAAIKRIAVEFLEATLHLAIARDDRIHIIGLIGIGHRRLKFFQLGRDRTDGPGPVHYFGDGATAGHLADILTEIANGDPAIDGDLPFVRHLLAGDHPEQRCLARAVGADKANLFTLQKHRRGFDEKDLMALLLADAVETNHGM